jgi:hypothetical protein
MGVVKNTTLDGVEPDVNLRERFKRVWGVV